METGPESGEHACEREKGLICDAPGCGVRLHDRVKVRRPTHEAIAGSCGLLGAVTCAARKRLWSMSSAQSSASHSGVSASRRLVCGYEASRISPCGFNVFACLVSLFAFLG